MTIYFSYLYLVYTLVASERRNISTLLVIGVFTFDLVFQWRECIISNVSILIYLSIFFLILVGGLTLSWTNLMVYHILGGSWPDQSAYLCLYVGLWPHISRYTLWYTEIHFIYALLTLRGRYYHMTPCSKKMMGTNNDKSCILKPKRKARSYGLYENSWKYYFIWFK